MKYQLLSPRPQVQLPAELPFGRVSTHHMVVADFNKESGWAEPTILPLKKFEVSPSAIAFHYGQQIFEGMKAYKGAGGKLHLFRPEMNADRFFNSAKRLAMEAVPQALFLESVRALVRVESSWIPERPGSLYIRPMLIPLDEGASYRAGQSYRFCVFVSPVQSYFGQTAAIEGVPVAVERTLSRAAPGGVGATKCGGNYAAALLGVQRAKDLGATDVVWLDSCSHQYVEEVGTMNLFFVQNGVLKTPELTGTILPGVTRDSLIRLARHRGFEVRVEKIAIEQVLKGCADGSLTEVFGCGTAAVISPIGSIVDGDKRFPLGKLGTESVALRLRQDLLAIQFGDSEDPFGWRYDVP
jgi:branched-chain amino acid aminotransferase